MSSGPDNSPGLLLRLRFLVEHGVLRAAVTLVPFIPYGLLRRLAWLLGTLGWLADYRGRANARMNLEVIFPELSAAERRRLARKSYRIFARTFLELFWSRRLIRAGKDRLEKFFSVQTDSADAERHMLDGHCIFVTAHVGNFEWLSHCRTWLSGDPILIIAQDFKNPPLTALFRDLRSLGGQTIVPQEGAMLKMFRHLKRGGTVAALVDLNVKPDQSAVPVRCFGRWISVSVLHAALAARTGRPIVPALALPGEDGRWVCRFFDPIHVRPDEEPAAVAQRCWDVMEPAIRAQPEAWLWMYKHWRYLPADAEAGVYPAYANPSKKFERLLREAESRP